MAQPPVYDRSYNFHDYQAENPLKPLPADKLDEEFARVKTTLDGILQNLKLIQRDDTALANNSVGYDQLRDEVDLGFNPPVDWAAETNYITRDTVFHDVQMYRCVVSHISSNDFTDDLNAGYWELVVDFATVQTTAIAARDAALQAQADAEDARDDALQAQSDAESARDVAIGAKNDALLAQAAAESARDAAGGYATTAGTHATNAGNAKTAAENARDAAILAKNAAEGFKDDAEAAAGDALGAWEDFSDQYLGAHATAPAGSFAGQMYFDTTYDMMMVYDGASWGPAASGGDMSGTIYDPNKVEGDVFDMDNMVEGSTNKILTQAERSAIADNTLARHTHANMTVLNATEEAFTTTLLNALNANTLARHTHANAAILNATEEAFTTTLLNALNANTSARHTHANAAILNATEQAFTTTLKNKLDATNTATFDTLSDVQSATIPSVVASIWVTGAADGNGALYKRVGSQPAHDRKVQSGDGAWWERSGHIGSDFLYDSGMRYSLSSSSNGYFIQYDNKAARAFTLYQDDSLWSLKGTGPTGAKRDAVYIQHMDYDTTDYYNGGDSFRVFSNAVNIFMSGAYEVGTGFLPQTKDLHGLQVLAMGNIYGWPERGVSGILASAEQIGDGIASNELSVRNPSWAYAHSKSMAAVQALVYNHYAASDATHQAVAVLASVSSDSYKISSLFKAMTGTEGAALGIDLSGITVSDGAIKMPSNGNGRGIIGYDANDYTNFNVVDNVFTWVIGGNFALTVNAGGISVGSYKTAANVGARLVLPISNANYAHIHLTPGGTPSSPQDGMIWFDGQLRIRIGGTTRTVNVT